MSCFDWVNTVYIVMVVSSLGTRVIDKIFDILGKMIDVSIVLL